MLAVIANKPVLGRHIYEAELLLTVKPVTDLKELDTGILIVATLTWTSLRF
jgi:hypothetical protein